MNSTETADRSELSVVVACVNGLPYIADCLDSLQAHSAGAEVIVADWTDEPTRARIREGWPDVKLLCFEEPTPVPLLRAAGMAAATAPYVAVIEDHCVVREGWGERILAAHRQGHSVVGGSIRNGATARIRDWAAFFCEYTEHMEPARGGIVPSLPGMNVSYDRAAIAAMDEFLRRGLWETWLHPHLQRSGFDLFSDPLIALDHVKDFGFREFLFQRYHYARSYAALRNPELGWKRPVYFLGSPLLIPLVTWRIARNVARNGRHGRAFAVASPLVALYIATWSLGEAVGYIAGDGGSMLKVR
jgi:glycosyltransferase involved in cell wall biosynthesis